MLDRSAGMFDLHPGMTLAEYQNRWLDLVSVGHQETAIADLLEGYKARRLTNLERTAFGEAALILKYDELEKAPVGVEKILAHRRSDDAAPTLWNTLNVVQENMMDGGQKDYNRRRPDSRRFFGKTRAVKGLDENVKLNKALWHMADRLRTSEPLTPEHNGGRHL